MPSRIMLPFKPLLSSHASTVLAPFLLPCLQYGQLRPASILSALSDNALAYNKKIRRGRGPSSGKGKTSGRGHKGQKQHGKVPRGFNGGQTPLEIVHGTRGFVNVFSVDMVPLNLHTLQSWIDQGRIDPSRLITLKELRESNCVGKIKDGVKLLADGADKLRQPVNIVVSRASASAIAAVEKQGGSVITRFYTPFAIQRILRGQTDPINSLRSNKTAAGMDVEDEEDEEDGEDVGVSEDSQATDVVDASDDIGLQSTKISDASVATLTPSFGYTHRLPDPTSRKDFEYYRDPAHRGYLSHTVTEGQTPSLFFKVPKISTIAVGKRAVKKAAVAENRLW